MSWLSTFQVEPCKRVAIAFGRSGVFYAVLSEGGATTIEGQLS
jgi:hypothetical protein